MRTPRLRLPRVRPVHRTGRRVVLILAAVHWACGVEANSQVVDRYRPGAEILRSANAGLVTVDSLDLSQPVDFDIMGERMAVVDMMDARVMLLRRVDGAWRRDTVFGRRGEGPGEMTMPHGITFTPDGGILVLDDDVFHLFEPDGAHVRTWSVNTPCPVTVGTVRSSTAGIFVSGNCLERDGGAGTVVAMLFWSADAASFIEVARETRYTLDGRSGFPLSMTAAFVDGPGRHVFGVGLSNCIARIDGSGPGTAPPRVERLCELAEHRYSAPPSPELERRLAQARRSRPDLRGLFDWPDALPWYMGALDTGRELVLMRPFTVDSVVVELAPGREEVLVAPLDGFVACRRTACLWTRQTPEGIRLTIVDVTDIERLREMRAPAR